MKRVFLCFCIIAFIFSCSESDDSKNQNSQSDDNFFALTVGNSWVYKNYKYNPVTETYQDIGVVDSISIVGVQDFSGESYYKFRRLTTGNEDKITFCNPNGEHFEFLRAFDGNLINEEGAIKFTNSNNEERLLQENEWGNIYEILVEGNTVISVEAGEFDCINSERYVKNSDGEQLPGLDRFYYASGVGLIYDTSSFVSNSVPSIIRSLDSYKVQ
ncbi:hypothetical protein [Formosa sp. A9]|uniref:hypothetical protein n=1 Tax=Formosa sp. A9 TaxID=3442641 RepID=UPI003EBC97CE